MDKRLLELLVCPICKGPCAASRRQRDSNSYAVRIGWPILCATDSLDAARRARTLNADDPLLDR
jgi:uncharacterized protein YbaR (Trm112 family)